MNSIEPISSVRGSVIVSLMVSYCISSFDFIIVLVFINLPIKAFFVILLLIITLDCFKLNALHIGC